MIKDKYAPTQAGRPIENSAASASIEEFFDLTDKKVYFNRVRREYLKNKLLFDINLEDRRCKLRSLLETETNQFIDENLNNMETIETRKNKLKDEAVRIRYQTEIERQQISQNKLIKAQQDNDDVFRQIQAKNHRMAIKHDWDKLKELKEREKREKECEKKYWFQRVKENTEDLIAKENVISNKKHEYKLACLEQIQLREKERQRLKVIEKQNILDNIVRFKKYNEDVKEERSKEHQDEYEKKQNYHQILDKHIETREKFKNRNKIYEDGFDNVMDDENVQKLKLRDQLFLLKKQNDMKSITDLIEYKRCLNKQKQLDECLINQNVIKVERELHKQRDAIEFEKNKKYQNLIKGIKAAQKDQMLVAEKRKALQKEEELVERERFNQLYLEGLKEDHIKTVKRKEFMRNYNNDLNAQIVFNEDLREINRSEHAREKKSMLAAEEEYLKVRAEAISGEKRLDLHPWRVR